MNLQQRPTLLILGQLHPWRNPPEPRSSNIFAEVPVLKFLTWQEYVVFFLEKQLTVQQPIHFTSGKTC